MRHEIVPGRRKIRPDESDAAALSSNIAEGSSANVKAALRVLSKSRPVPSLVSQAISRDKASSINAV